MLGRWSSDAHQIYIHTPISTIVGVANLILVVFVGCLRTLVVKGQGFPEPLFPSPIWLTSAWRVPSAWNEGSWLGCGDLPTTGAVSYLGAGWLQWKPLGIQGTHLPLKCG